MSAVLNDRDAILQAATVRIVNPKNAWINLTASAPGFHLNAAGQVDLAKVTVTADLVGLDDAVTFTAVGGTLSNAVGRSVDVTYNGQTAIVTAKVVSNGDEFQRALIIPVLRDGASGTGTPGARGAGHYYGSGTAWTDALANITVPTAKVVGDVVTISSGTYVMEKRWTGSAWIETGTVINGGLIVTGSVLGSAIKAGTLDIRKADGTVIVRADSTIADQIPNGALSFVQIGGDLSSTNYVNGQSGWYLERNGDIWVNNLRSRGYLCGGAISGWAWPAAGAGAGFYVGPQGALFGNRSDNLWLALLADGTIDSKNFNVTPDGRVTINGALIINPQINNPTTITEFSVSIPSIQKNSQANSSSYVTYGTLGINPVNGSGQYQCQWQISVESGDVILIPSTDGTVATIKGRGSNIMALASVSVTVVDTGKNITKIAGAFIRYQHGTGQIS